MIGDVLPIPPHVKRVLLRSLKTEEEEYGKRPEIDDARAWVKAVGEAGTIRTYQQESSETARKDGDK
jgi:hypothetical protein